MLVQHLYLSFEQQLKLIRNSVLQKFEQSAIKKSSSKQDVVNEDFSNQTERAFKEAVNSFKTLASELILDGSGWGEHVLNHETDLTMQLRTFINNARDKEIDKLKHLTQQAAKDNLEQIINGPIYELNPEFWEEIRTPYLKELQDLAYSCEQILQKSFKCDLNEVSEFMKNLDQTLHQFTVDYVRRLFRDINTNLLRKFNKIFKKDEQGKNREWRDIEEG